METIESAEQLRAQLGMTVDEFMKAIGATSYKLIVYSGRPMNRNVSDRVQRLRKMAIETAGGMHGFYGMVALKTQLKELRV